MTAGAHHSSWLVVRVLALVTSFASVTSADAGKPFAAPPVDDACTAQALDEEQPGGHVATRCVPNLVCVDACSEAFGDALAVSAQQSPLNEENCAGDRECLATRAQTIRAAQAQALETLSFCLTRCWKHRDPGTCYQDTDCPAKGPCQPGACRRDHCTTENVYDGTACTDPTGGALCLDGACVSSTQFLLGCGDLLAKLSSRHPHFEEQVARCRSHGDCTSLRSRLDAYLSGNGRALIDCVQTALDAGAAKGSQP